MVQITDNILSLEKDVEKYLDMGDYSSPDERKKLFDSVNRSRRYSAVFINTILSNKEFYSFSWAKFDDFFDEIMEQAVVVMSGDDAAVRDALNQIITTLAGGRARAFSIRDKVFTALLST